MFKTGTHKNTFSMRSKVGVGADGLGGRETKVFYFPLFSKLVSECVQVTGKAKIDGHLK